jgi:hypothetical protein
MSASERRCPVCDGPIEPLHSEGDGLNSYVVGWLCLETGLCIGKAGGEWTHYKPKPSSDD